MTTFLLDTNIISSILKRLDGSDTDSQRIKSKLQSALEKNSTILISPVVFYEIARGLYHRKLEKHMIFFAQLIEHFKWCDFSKDTWDTAAKLWASCRTGGKPTGEGLDKDVLIAAQTQEHKAVVVTNNIVHFKNLGVFYESW